MFKNLSIIVIFVTMISACNNDDDDGGGKTKSMAGASSPVVVDNSSKYENKFTELEKQIDELKDKLDNKTPATPVITPPPPDTFVAGKVFQDRLKDGSFGPEMVMIAGGTFRMGSDEYLDEQPVHDVSVDRFAMGKFEVTFAEYDKFAEATNRKKPDDRGWGRGNRPVINVSWNDATAYAKWLSDQTGKEYRLPTEAEWEYAARAGTETSRYWGNDPDLACSYANVHDNTSKEKNDFFWTHHNCTDGYAQTAPVGSFKANKFGLYDMLGNLWEWTCSEYRYKYNNK